MDVDKAAETQVRNIQTRSGKTLDQLFGVIRGSGLGHGDANTLAHVHFKSSAPAESAGADPLDAICVGGKAHLRPIHERKGTPRSSPGSGRRTRARGRP